MRVLGTAIALFAVHNKVNANDCTSKVAWCVEKAISGQYTECTDVPLKIANARRW